MDCVPRCLMRRGIFWLMSGIKKIGQAPAIGPKRSPSKVSGPPKPRAYCDHLGHVFPSLAFSRSMIHSFFASPHARVESVEGQGSSYVLDRRPMRRRVERGSRRQTCPSKISEIAALESGSLVGCTAPIRSKCSVLSQERLLDGSRNFDRFAVIYPYISRKTQPSLKYLKTFTESKDLAIFGPQYVISAPPFLVIPTILRRSI